MLHDLPHELVLVIFDLASREAPTAKALRLVNHEFELRFARVVWMIGATTHYLNYLRRLPVVQRRVTVCLLIPHGATSLRCAATVAAQATSEAMPQDERLFKALARCTKFRV